MDQTLCYQQQQIQNFLKFFVGYLYLYSSLQCFLFFTLASP